jgi:hypothetical protein
MQSEACSLGPIVSVAMVVDSVPGAPKSWMLVGSRMCRQFSLTLSECYQALPLVVQPQ